jgi:aspartyl/asparaginyl-tRNA synthetase
VRGWWSLRIFFLVSGGQRGEVMGGSERETSWAPMDSNKKEKGVDRGREGRWADLFCNPQTPRI